MTHIIKSILNLGNMKRFICFAFLLFICLNLHSQPINPDTYLGYSYGSKYTAHHKVVSYFEQEQKNNPGLIKIENYGTTNEGRPLIAVILSTSENMKNLEAIRANNLRNARSLNDGIKSTVNGKAIVWLSYNVHGNETSGTEAAMKTYYELMTKKDFNEVLKDLIIIIDPCLNPDGRERYINWFNSVSGSSPDLTPFAREHQEPWPGGRTNHYYFDLNRDWAWQTQVESRARIKLYNQWLPHIHVDFHEQSVNNPYYFAPAAEPFHEAITPFQRTFQRTIGVNNAKYFDEKSWLYFTNERFDLFYPSYGDTYPTYTGAIGMTYEQAGGSRAGTAIKINDETVLTLKDRIDHHTTTGLSTVEIASQNAASLNKEFVKYYDNSTKVSATDYNTFVLKYAPENEQRLAGIKDLMDINAIEYGSSSGSITGFDYYTGKEAKYSLSAKDVVIKTQQSRSTLVKVLFEPKSMLFDSITYDITAWSLPYVYGLNAIATNQVLSITPLAKDPEVKKPEESYGYAMPWKGGMNTKVFTQLLNKKVKLRFSEQSFVSDGKTFDRGTILILSDNNQPRSKIKLILEEIQKTYNVEFFPLKGGMVEKGFDMGSDRIRYIKAPRIVLLTGEGTGSNAVGEIWHHLDKELGYPVTLANSTNFENIKLSETDVIVMADGNYRFLRDKELAEILQNWIAQGGKLIAFEGAVEQLSDQKWINLKKRSFPNDSSYKDPYKYLKIYENREKDEISDISPGAIYKVEMDNTHPLAFGYPKHYFSLKQSSTFYDYIKTGGWNVGVIKSEQQIQGFVGSKLRPKFKNSLVFGVQEEGRGQIIFFTDDVLFRNFWENGKLMFDNAVFLVGQ